jgi:hypothetical protein
MNRTLRILFWLSVAFSFVMATLPHPPPIPGEPADKVQHMAAFSTMSLLAALAYRRISLLRIGLALSAFGAFIEFVQMIPMLHRDAELLDWVADSAAVAVVLGAIAVIWRRRAN